MPEIPKGASERTLVVTGFGPFQNNDRNPSGELAEALDGRVVSGVRIRGFSLSVTWRGSWEAIRDEVDASNASALLCLGIAPHPFLRLETRARNLAVPEADILGEFPALVGTTEIVLGAPPYYPSSLPLPWLADQLTRQRAARSPRSPTRVIEARFWDDAGTFLCNHVFYHAMHELGGRLRACGFVHLPRLAFAGEAGRPGQRAILASGLFLVEALAAWLGENERRFRSERRLASTGSR
jgi:pyroglutamyl-peptidase